MAATIAANKVLQRMRVPPHLFSARLAGEFHVRKRNLQELLTLSHSRTCRAALQRDSRTVPVRSFPALLHFRQYLTEDAAYRSAHANAHRSTLHLWSDFGNGRNLLLHICQCPAQGLVAFLEALT